MIGIRAGEAHGRRNRNDGKGRQHDDGERGSRAESEEQDDHRDPCQPGDELKHLNSRHAHRAEQRAPERGEGIGDTGPVGQNETGNPAGAARQRVFVDGEVQKGRAAHELHKADSAVERCGKGNTAHGLHGESDNLPKPQPEQCSPGHPHQVRAQPVATGAGHARRGMRYQTFAPSRTIPPAGHGYTFSSSISFSIVQVSSIMGAQMVAKRPASAASFIAVDVAAMSVFRIALQVRPPQRSTKRFSNSLLFS